MGKREVYQHTRDLLAAKKGNSYAEGENNANFKDLDNSSSLTLQFLIRIIIIGFMMN